MTRAPSQGPVVEVKPQPNIYPVLLVVALVALIVAIALGLRTLTSAPPNGYGMNMGQLLDPLTRSLPAK